MPIKGYLLITKAIFVPQLYLSINEVIKRVVTCQLIKAIFKKMFYVDTIKIQTTIHITKVNIDYKVLKLHLMQNL